MRRTCIVAFAAIAAVGTPVTAQWFGMPAWNSPEGGGGITLSADYGRTDFNDDTDPFEASSFGARGSLALGRTTLALGVSRFDSEGTDPTITVVGAQAAFRVLGGGQLPVAVNLQAGVSRHGVIDGGSQDVPNWLAGVGISTTLPATPAEIEPYVSVSNRWHRVSGASDSEANLGFVLGANVNFTTFGVHVAYDSESFEGDSRLGVFGLGAHVTLRLPIGT